MKRILNGFVIGIMIVLLFAGWQMYQDNNDSSITVIEQIKKVAKLQTIEMKAATTLSKSKKDWAGATKYTVYFAEGTVTASIDLEKMNLLNKSGRTQGKKRGKTNQSEVQRLGSKRRLPRGRDNW